ncbi:site-specific integrase [Algoriphagus pacificus]|uniref:Site-specific integrase n=1 Tax=Algoriphagus pacificus TaxID=2811234 RepID=A0ABS3CMT0_9BACT|nr:site-specific integrase [Algoriphagus pacificus]MBN7818025.1 site-specific integrase [Algoriphagus pacificus]
MRASNSFGVHFIIKTSKLIDGKAPIFARIVVESRRVEISMKQRVIPDQWSKSKGMGRGTRQEILDLNTYLEQVRVAIISDYQELQVRKKRITAELLKSRYLGEEEKEHTLNKLVEYHNTEFTEQLKMGTLKNYFTTARYLSKFLKKKYRTNDFALEDIDFAFLHSFETYLRRNRPSGHQRPMSNNGVMKHLERFQKLMRLAVKLQWIVRNPFEQYQIRFEKVEMDFLSQEELDNIHQLIFTSERLELVRDLFVFACYTGLSYSDLAALTPDSIYKGVDGEPWITGRRKKTKEPYHVPLLYPALELIEKYKENNGAKLKGSLFPILSNQKLNSYLKEIADLCRIKKNLTFHMARHTFATTVTLLNGVPIESLSKMLGHNKLSTTQIYARVIQLKLSHDMAALRDKLAPKPSSSLEVI